MYVCMCVWQYVSIGCLVGRLVGTVQHDAEGPPTERIDTNGNNITPYKSLT